VRPGWLAPKAVSSSVIKMHFSRGLASKRGTAEGPLRALQPLEVIPLEPRTTQANAFIWHLGQHPTWATAAPAGQKLRYLIRDCDGRDLACLLFGAAAWKVKARDAFIGWSAQQRQEPRCQFSLMMRTTSRAPNSIS
jgi:Domain of unknown function (DUF4338)